MVLEGVHLKPGETVLARIGSSFTSVEGARRNLESEIPAGTSLASWKSQKRSGMRS